VTTRASRAPRRSLRVALRIALVLLATALLLELFARALLFGWVPADRLGLSGLRAPAAFADAGEDEYWTLKRYLEAERGRELSEPNKPDAELGWVKRYVTPGTWAHKAHVLLEGRWPVLLFGDSFAQCVTPQKDCFQGLLERSDLGSRYLLMNYGVGGYGVDQAYMLMTRSLDQWQHRLPVVVFSLFLDGDLDRTGLEFREWPKPRFELRDGELVLEREQLPSTVEYMQREFPPRTSWAWRMLVHSQLLPERWAERLSGRDRREERVRQVSLLVLERAAQELRRRELPFCFVLFHGQRSASRPEVLGWRENEVVALLERLDVPYVLAGPALIAASEEEGRPLRDYFLRELPGRGHLNALGNEVVLRQMMERVEEQRALHEATRPLGPWLISKVVRTGRVASARYEEGERPQFEAPEDRRRLFVRVGKAGPTEVHYDLEGRVRSFEALAWIPPGGSRGAGSVAFEVIADGELLLELVVRGGEPKRAIEVDLAGRTSLVLRAGDAGDGVGGDLLLLSRPTFR